MGSVGSAHRICISDTAIASFRLAPSSRGRAARSGAARKGICSSSSLWARRTVLERTGIELRPEVRLVGDFEPPLPSELQPHRLKPLLPGTEVPAVEMPDRTKSCLRVQP